MHTLHENPSIRTENPQVDNPPKAAPIQGGERILSLDIIRGFALLGVLLANMAWFNSPALYQDVLGVAVWPNLADRLAAWFIDFFVQGKFYSIFSILFGFGFSIFIARAQERVSSPKWLFYKRLIVLLLIGLLHAFFIWYGDILVTYALLGMLLPLFYHKAPKSLIRWTITLFSVYALFVLFVMGIVALGMKFKVEGVEIAQKSLEETMTEFMVNANQAYGSGTFMEIMAHRKAENLFIYNQLFATLFTILPLFLLGLYAGKRNLFQPSAQNLSFIKKTWGWSLVVGFSMSVVKFIFKHFTDNDYFSFDTAVHSCAALLADTGLCLFYITSIILLCRNARWLSRLTLFAYIGRMPLTNYLLQSIVCTTLFYSYGFGLYGKVSPTLGLLISLTIYVAQIFVSKWWLSRYQFGPVEWLWKCLTYGKRFVITKE